jgi:HD-GYP domain-containing protein (c-di-GMP phosphodiesterase class II)/phosphoribosyl 1,2-cyclic phosphodiesterase
MKNSIKILGAYGSKGNGFHSTCIQVDHNVVIDAGNILSGLKNEAVHIDHIFITHSHLDHICDIPFFIDTFFTQRTNTLTIYGLKETLEYIKTYIFNWHIWPDFSEIKLIHKNFNAIVFKEIKIGQTIELDNCSLKAIANNHTSCSCGYVVTKNNHATLFSSDTFICDTLFDEINTNKQIKSAIFDISFPSRFETLAKDSKHFTPKIFKDALKKLQRKEVILYINHLKPAYFEELKQEINALDIFENGGAILEDGDIITLDGSKKIYNDNFIKTKDIHSLLEIGQSLTSEKDFNVLMEKIVIVAKEFTDADAGTLYLVDEASQSLAFSVVQTDSLKIKMGGTQEKITWPTLPLYINGEKNEKMVAAMCALDNKLINIIDVYHEKGFDFQGTKNFDKSTGYRTKSMLVVPMTNHEGDVIGVLQLLNKKDEQNQSVAFTPDDERIILSMASQAAISMTNRTLLDDLENLLNSFVKSIATAIDEKSPYTGGHISRVAEIATMFIDAINEDTTIYEDKFYNEDERKEIKTAAWMHDIGKITTPEYVVDKARKLQTIHDRISEVKVRFELLKTQKKLEFYEKINQCDEPKQKQAWQEDLHALLLQLDDDFKFVQECNTGGEFMEDAKIQRIETIARYTYVMDDELHPLLSENEVYNLCIKKGTLTAEERLVINNHSLMSIKMLESLPFPKKLKQVPSIAGAHHEKICGGGYPFNLKGEEISFEARILAIADIFEALTAHDRPYKDANSLNQSMKILSFMAKDNELDKDLIKFFVKKGLHMKYAKKYLMPSQFDDITVDFDAL